MLSIDITDKQIKLVRGTLSGVKIRVVEVETRDLTLGCVSNGYITDIPMVAGEITDIISSKGIKDKEAIVCINSGSILYKDLIVPKPKKISNSSAIESMILNTMGITKEYNISYSIIGDEKGENGEDMLRLLAMACPQRMVDGYIRLFTQLGLNLKQINISNNCISRLILNTPKLESSMPLMLVQVDNDFVNINLYEDNQVTLNRYVRIDPYDYSNDEDYVNQAVYDNVFRTIQFIQQRKDAKPLKEIMFYGHVKDFIALSNAVSSFNVPAHILNMPSNVVTFCDFDFAEYANALGAFLKVRKDLDHINLLEASAVKGKKGASTFLITTILLAVAAVVVSAVGVVVCDSIAGNIQAEADQIDAEIHSEAMNERIRVLNEKISVFEGVNLYRTNLEAATTLFDYQPRGITEVKAKVEEAIGDLDMNIMNDITIAGYNVAITMRCYDEDTPTKYIRNLIDQDYFEDIVFTGFTSESQDEEEDDNTTTTRRPVVNRDNREGLYSFAVSMRIKGGNSVELN
ncbi:MAG: hypothetical protein NC084_09495 [Bacteroides sp.]|nr:competence protein ComA [Eubacterium sp.]MCM1417483.1 competence protein ComA [Roseburia sp.]MCM1462931.1 hypothetical protein [Bacteroides sp.]